MHAKQTHYATVRLNSTLADKSRQTGGKVREAGRWGWQSGMISKILGSTATEWINKFLSTIFTCLHISKMHTSTGSNRQSPSLLPTSFQHSHPLLGSLLIEMKLWQKLKKGRSVPCHVFFSWEFLLLSCFYASVSGSSWRLKRSPMPLTFWFCDLFFFLPVASGRQSRRKYTIHRNKLLK